MKKKLRSILALLMAVLMVAAFTACGSNGSSSSSASGGKLQEVLDRGYLIVGTGSTNAPWHFYDDNGNLCGFDVSMAKSLPIPSSAIRKRSSSSSSPLTSACRTWSTATWTSASSS